MDCELFLFLAFVATVNDVSVRVDDCCILSAMAPAHTWGSPLISVGDQVSDPSEFFFIFFLPININVR